MSESSFADDLDALHAQEAETRAEHLRRGNAIQHRNWALPDAFRSDDERPFAIPSSQPLSHRPLLEALQLPSSPPTAAMPYISSPIAYPETSSAHPSPSPKRRRVARQQPSTGKNAMFVEEDDEDEDVAGGDDLLMTHQPVQELQLPRLESQPDTIPPSQSQIPSLPPSQTQQSQSTDLGLSLLARRAIAPPTLGDDSRRSLGLRVCVRTSAGKTFSLRKRARAAATSYEELAAARSEVHDGKTQRNFYGIDIVSLMKEAKSQAVIDAAQAQIVPTKEPIPAPCQAPPQKRQHTLMWTEKYRAKKFTDLVGDDRTHRNVMHWLKRWDDVVFPGSSRAKSKARKADEEAEPRPHRKILLLTGAPGLGKTTLAHVCARQAGYEVMEINASDERSSQVVKGRIRDMVGTESVKNVTSQTGRAGVQVGKLARPVCVIVDEVDGVVGGSGGSGGGEGGFIKALLDLVALDQRNSRLPTTSTTTTTTKSKKKNDKFRLLRPVVLICNDVYHPSLRPLRQSTLADIIHVGKPALNTVVTRMSAIFQRENVPHDTDGVRKLCEAAWGMSGKKESGPGSSSTGEGDIRGVLVVAEWIASKLRQAVDPLDNAAQRLTRRWIESNVLADLSHGGGSARGLGRGGAREVVDRVFREGAGFGKSAVALAAPDASISGVKGVAEATKARSMQRLGEMIDTSGESDRIVSDCFAAYPTYPYQDDNYLTKPDAAYEWLAFHDRVSAAVHGRSEWELAPYLGRAILAFHHLFASSSSLRHMSSKPAEEDATAGNPAQSLFTGPQAAYHAHERQKQNEAVLQLLHGTLSPPLTRLFSSPAAMATDLVPYLARMLSPNVNPVVVGGSRSGGSTAASAATVRKASEKALLSRAVEAMTATGVRFEQTRLEPDTSATGPQPAGAAGWVYRMEPAIDDLATLASLARRGNAGTGAEKVRYAVRHALEQEFAREEKRRDAVARKARWEAGGGGGGAGAATSAASAYDDGDGEEKENRPPRVDDGLSGQPQQAVKRDFFGRVIARLTAQEAAEEAEVEREGEVARKRRKGNRGTDGKGGGGEEGEGEGRVWVTFHEGYSNAVRKPIGLAELMGGL